MIADDFLILLSVKYLDLHHYLSHYFVYHCVNAIIPHFTYFLSCISRFLLVNLSKFGAGMLIKCCILPTRNIKSAKASGAPPWKSSQRSPNPLAGFKAILCLVVFP